MVYTGFAMSLLSLILVQIALVVRGSPVWPVRNANFETIVAMQTAFDSVFTLPGVLVFASMRAYLVAQLLDVGLFILKVCVSWPSFVAPQQWVDDGL